MEKIKLNYGKSIKINNNKYVVQFISKPRKLIKYLLEFTIKLRKATIDK